MKRISRILSVLLAVVMAFTTLCVTSFAATNVASVTIDGTTTNYTTIAAAFKSISAGDTATVTLLGDTTVSGSSTAGTNYNISIKGNTTFDLGGYTLTFSSNNTKVYPLFELAADANVTVTNGTISCKNRLGAFSLKNDNVSLKLDGVTIINATSSSSASYRCPAVTIRNTGTASFEATDCTFQATSVSYQAAILVDSSSSAVSLNFTNCTLNGKYAALCMKGNLEQVDVTFTNCDLISTLRGVELWNVVSSNTSTITLDNSSVTVPTYYYVFAKYSTSSSGVAAVITGTEDKEITGSLNVADSGITLTVSDGIYTDSSVANYVADGYAAYVYVAGTSWIVDPATSDITVSETTNGSVTVTVDSEEVTEALEDDTVTITATPDTGYEVDTVTVTGESGAVTVTDNGDGTYTFTMPDEDVTVTVTFVLTDYTVSLSEVENGTVTTDTTTANMGDTVEVTITPDAGYRVGTVIITDSENNTIEYTASGDDYSFTMPASEVTVAVTFVKDDLSLAIGTTTGGTVEASDGSETAQLGDTVTITVTPDTGYETSEVTITYVDENGNTIEVAVTDNGDGTYSFEMPAYPVSIAASFTKIDYTTTDSETVYVDHGYYTVSPTTANYGDTVTITTYPDNVYKVSEIVVVDENGNVIAVINNGDGTYSFEMPAGNVTITVTYAQYASEITGVIYVNEQYHGYFINGHLACVEHTVDANGYCTVCKAYVGTAAEETEETAEVEETETTEETVDIEEPVEDTDTDTEDDEEPDDMEVSEPETASNPTTGLSLALIPMAIALAGAAFGKRK